MKDMIKNDDAVSVVVGAILVLAVLVTFMSVVTSSWVPIYEGNAESAHSDDTHKAFMDIHKQIEMADEFARSATINLGTEEMQFIQNSNSVGMLEVNESDGGLFVTGNITSPAPDSAVGLGLTITGMNTNQTNPITDFSFEFNQLDPNGNGDKDKLDQDFMAQFRTSTLERWISLYKDPSDSSDKTLGMYVRYGSDSNEKWIGTAKLIDYDYPDLKLSNGLVYINLLSYNLTLDLIEPTNQNVSLNGVVYNTNGNKTATFNDIIQHYMRLPADGTGSDYYIDYVQYNGIFEGEQLFTYNTTQELVQLVTTSGETITPFDNFKIGGGTLKLQSDYNFMVDQSYIYDSGAVILRQDDGAVFKVNPPILATNNSDGNLTLTLKNTVLKGNYQASGNGIETLYTALDGGVYGVSGVTDNITIVKNTTPEYYDLWFSYFTEISDVVYSSNANYYLPYDSNKQQLVLNINSINPDITITVQKKVIIIS